MPKMVEVELKNCGEVVRIMRGNVRRMLEDTSKTSVGKASKDSLSGDKGVVRDAVCAELRDMQQQIEELVKLLEKL